MALFLASGLPPGGAGRRHSGPPRARGHAARRAGRRRRDRRRGRRFPGPLWTTGLSPPDSSPVAAPSQLPTAAPNPTPAWGYAPTPKLFSFRLPKISTRGLPGGPVPGDRLRWRSRRNVGRDSPEAQNRTLRGLADRFRARLIVLVRLHQWLRADRRGRLYVLTELRDLPPPMMDVPARFDRHHAAVAARQANPGRFFPRLSILRNAPARSCARHAADSSASPDRSRWCCL